MWSFEHDARKTGFKFIAGIDEAGRGPLAGPVISAAVILPFDFPDPGIDDSKKLSQKKREQFFPIIMEHAVCVSTGRADHDEIDRINILAASLKSMERAVNGLSIVPDYLLIDGKFTIHSAIAQKAIIKGDSRSISIAAASIIAKVTRDAIMQKIHNDFPEYGFDRHKGYPTKAHRKVLAELGPCPWHRKSFKGVVKNPEG